MGNGEGIESRRQWQVAVFEFWPWWRHCQIRKVRVGQREVLTAMKAIGTLIREKREQLYSTQKEFAYEVGIEPTHYSHIENGIACITLRTLFKICRHLHITPWELLEAALKPFWEVKKE